MSSSSHDLKQRIRGTEFAVSPRPASGLRGAVLLAALWGIALSGVAADQRVLRVAADPNNLPFSNERREGFENRIAELMAKDLGARLEYMWWPQRRGFFRETVGSGRADVVIGVPAGFDRVLTTRPYYRSTYVFVSRPGDARVSSFDDPNLPHRIIGVQLIGDDAYNAPPAHALSARGMINNIRGYTVYGDYGQDSPPSAIIKAVAARDIDLAVAWGPMAGFYAARQSVPLEITPVSPEADGPSRPFTFAIAMGVRRGDAALKQELQSVLDRHQGEIDAILDEFHVPRVPIEAATNKDHHVAAR